MGSKKLCNRIMLITYADSLGKNLKELKEVLDTYFTGAVDGVHILPFFPSSADRGFAPMRYDKVEEAFGDFDDIAALAGDHPLMFDFMVNHISRSSDYFQDFLKKSFPGKSGGQDLRPSRLKQPQGPLPLPPCRPPATPLCALCTKIRPEAGKTFP